MDNAKGDLIWFLAPDGVAFIEDVYLPIGLTTIVVSIVASVAVVFACSSLKRRKWPAAGFPGAIGRWLLCLAWAFAVFAAVIPALYLYLCARSIQTHFQQPSSLHAVAVDALSEPIAQLCVHLEAGVTNRTPDQIDAHLESLVAGTQTVSPQLLHRLAPTIDQAMMREIRESTRQVLAAKGRPTDFGFAWKLSMLTDMWLQQADPATIRQSSREVLLAQQEGTATVASLAETVASQQLHPALMTAAREAQEQPWRAGRFDILGWAVMITLGLYGVGRRNKPFNPSDTVD